MISAHPYRWDRKFFWSSEANQQIGGIPLQATQPNPPTTVGIAIRPFGGAPFNTLGFLPPTGVVHDAECLLAAQSSVVIHASAMRNAAVSITSSASIAPNATVIRSGTSSLKSVTSIAVNADLIRHGVVLLESSASLTVGGYTSRGYGSVRPFASTPFNSLGYWRRVTPASEISCFLSARSSIHVVGQVAKHDPMLRCSSTLIVSARLKRFSGLCWPFIGRTYAPLYDE